MPSQLEEQGMGGEEALGLFMCLELPSACRGAGGQAGAFCVQELLGSEVLRRWQGRSSPWAVQLLVLSLGAQHKGTCLAPAMPVEAHRALRKAAGPWQVPVIPVPGIAEDTEISKLKSKKTDTRQELLSDALCHLPALANLQCAVQSERLDKTQRFS